jgi:hypothetical protein
MHTTDIATDRRRGPMSEMVLYTEHPFLPIHAALFSNFDSTFSVVVSDRYGRPCDGAYTVSLAGDLQSLDIVLRPGNRGAATFEDKGHQFTGIRFELHEQRPVAV